jgi:hypothetical protein
MNIDEDSFANLLNTLGSKWIKKEDLYAYFTGDRMALDKYQASNPENLAPRDIALREAREDCAQLAKAKALQQIELHDASRTIDQLREIINAYLIPPECSPTCRDENCPYIHTWATIDNEELQQARYDVIEFSRQLGEREKEIDRLWECIQDAAKQRKSFSEEVVRAAEREACARIVDSSAKSHRITSEMECHEYAAVILESIATLIRFRGNNK